MLPGGLWDVLVRHTYHSVAAIITYV